MPSWFKPLETVALETFAWPGHIFYRWHISIATNYIRKSRTDKNIVWKAPTDYGEIEISINLSKPEKDPKEIARAGKVISRRIPKVCIWRNKRKFCRGKS